MNNRGADMSVIGYSGNYFYDLIVQDELKIDDYELQTNDNGDFVIENPNGTELLNLDNSGNLTLTGSLTTTGLSLSGNLDMNNNTILDVGQLLVGTSSASIGGVNMEIEDTSPEISLTTGTYSFLLTQETDGEIDFHNFSNAGNEAFSFRNSGGSKLLSMTNNGLISIEVGDLTGADDTNFEIYARGNNSGEYLSLSNEATTGIKDAEIRIRNDNDIKFLISTIEVVNIDSNGINLITGNEYEINNTSVLSSTTLGSTIINSSLTSVGELLDLTIDGAGLNLILHDDSTTLTGIGLNIGQYKTGGTSGTKLMLSSSRTSQSASDCELYFSNYDSGFAGTSKVGLIGSVKGIGGTANDPDDGGGISLFYSTDGLTLTEGITLDSLGNVGIGTNSPTTDLHLFKSTDSTSMIIENDTDIVALSFLANTSGTGAGIDSEVRIKFQDGLSGSEGFIGYQGAATDNNTYLQIGHIETGGFSQVGNNVGSSIFIKGGDVGIGIVGPTDKLHIFNSGTGDAILRISRDDTPSGCKIGYFDNNDILFIKQIENNDIRFDTNDTERMRIDNNGNIGIGTNSPTTDVILDLSSTTSAFMPPRMTTTQRNSLTASNGMIIYNTTTSSHQGYNGSWNSFY